MHTPEIFNNFPALIYTRVISCTINTLACWVLICSVVGTLFLKTKPILLIRDKKHPLEIDLMKIDYLEN